MADPATVLADWIESALARIESARAAAEARLAALEQIVEASIADLDRVLEPATR